MERRGRKLRAQSSPERTKIWVEPNSKNHANLKQKNKRVPVVYYLSKNRHLEHPHFIEVPLSSSEGLFLKDVINRLNVLRGKGMASMYSWSCKRGYKNGFVWHDLSEDDIVLPSNGNEYILKGSEILDKSPPDRLSQICKTETLIKPNKNPKIVSSSSNSHSTSPSPSSSSSKDEIIIIPVRNGEKEEKYPKTLNFINNSNYTASSSGASSPNLTEYKISKSFVAQDASTQTEERKSRQKPSNPNSPLNPNSFKSVSINPNYSLVSDPSSSSNPNLSPSRNPNSSPRVPNPNSSPRVLNPNFVRLRNPNSSPRLPTNPNFSPTSNPNSSPRVPPNPNFSPPVPNPNSYIASSSGTNNQMDTLESLIRAEASRQITQIRVPQKDEILESPKPSNLLLQLLTCNKGFGIVPNYRPRFTQLGFPSPVPVLGTGTGTDEKGKVIRGLDKLNESSRTELGFMAEEVFDNGLRRSTEEERANKPTLDSKCLPKISYKYPSKGEIVKSPPQGPNCNLSPEGPNCNNKLSSKGVSKRTVMSDSVLELDSLRLESFNKDRIFKIEERLSSGARVVIQSNSLCDSSDESSDSL